MKVVIQNGANNWLSRKDAESVIRRLPSSWSSSISQVLLAAGPSLSTSFHPKERVVCLYCPSAPRVAQDKRVAVSALLRALAGAACAELPDGLEHECQEAVDGPAA